jgi:hypothetical protein
MVLRLLGVFARVPSLKNSGRGFKEGEIKPLPESSLFTSAPGRSGATALA